MPNFDVVGAGGQVFTVTGEEILGMLLDEDEVDGDDDDDDFSPYVGAAAKRKAKRRAKVKTAMKLNRADWRDRQLAPGVQAPDQGVYPLGLTPSNNTGIFGVGVPQISYVGAVQKPFRGERIMARVVRTGATATGTLLAQIFAGTDLQQASIRGVNIENVGDVQGFGVRLTMVPVQPGVELTLVVTPTVIPAGADTISLDIEILGRIVA